KDRWYSNDNTLAFGPRISFAWDPLGDGKTVVRIGYGIAFDPISSFQITSISGKVPGLVTQCRITVGQNPPPGCATGVKELEPPQTIPNPTRIGQGFPLILPPPDRLPSSFTGPAPAPRLIAPDTGVFDQKLKLPTVHEWN